MKKYMEITEKTKTFAQDGQNYLLTNEQNWNYETADHQKIMACRVNMRYEEITECVSLNQFTNHDPYWMIPEHQLTAEELEKVKNFKKV